MRRFGVFVGILSFTLVMGLSGVASAAQKPLQGEISRTGSCQGASQTDSVAIGYVTIDIGHIGRDLAISARTIVKLDPSSNYELYLFKEDSFYDGKYHGCSAYYTSFSTNEAGVGVGTVSRDDLRRRDLDPGYRNLGVAICVAGDSCLGTDRGWSSSPNFVRF